MRRSPPLSPTRGSSVTVWMKNGEWLKRPHCALVPQTRWGLLGQTERWAVASVSPRAFIISVLAGGDERGHTHTLKHSQTRSHTMIYAVLCLKLTLSFCRSFNELEINRIPISPPPLRRCPLPIFVRLPFVWLVSIPIISRFNDHWVTSEIESTWQPESARTASRVQISHPGEVLSSGVDDRSLKWMGGGGDAPGVSSCLNWGQHALLSVCDRASVSVRASVCVCVCVFVSSSIKRCDSAAQSKATSLRFVVSCFFRCGWAACDQTKPWAIQDSVGQNNSSKKSTDCPVHADGLFHDFPPCWLRAGLRLVSQLQRLFWSFPIKHDPPPLILFCE